MLFVSARRAELKLLHCVCDGIYGDFFIFSRILNHRTTVHNDGRESDDVLFIHCRYGPRCQLRRETGWEYKGVFIDQFIDQSVHLSAPLQPNNQKI